MFYEWPACLALDSNTVIYFIQGCVKRLFHRPLKSLVINYHGQYLCCQGSARSVDLQALDSNKRYIFHYRVREKGLFHRPLNPVIISGLKNRQFKIVPWNYNETYRKNQIKK